MRKTSMAAGAAAVLVACLSVPALAGPAELNLLGSYVGNWTGVGVLRGGDRGPETFRCRMAITPGASSRINYSGRCSLIGTNISVAGTIGFNDATRRYQAAMSSNAGFAGAAVGYRRGNRIDFELKPQRISRGGTDMTISSGIHLAGGAITVDYRAEINNSGQVLTAVVPFRR